MVLLLLFTACTDTEKVVTTLNSTFKSTGLIAACSSFFFWKRDSYIKCLDITCKKRRQKVVPLQWKADSELHLVCKRILCSLCCASPTASVDFCIKGSYLYMTHSHPPPIHSAVTDCRFWWAQEHRPDVKAFQLKWLWYEQCAARTPAC